MKPCPLRLDTPPALLADALLEAGWTLADLEAGYCAVVLCFLSAGGWETAPAGVVLDEWEMVLPTERHDAQEAA